MSTSCSFYRAGARLNVALLASVALAAVCTSSVCGAEPDPVRAEARQRFDAGVQLFKQGDSQGALAEFQRANEISPHPLLQYNLGLVYVALGNPLRAIEAFDRLLASPGAVDQQKLERARNERSAQAERVGQIELQTNATQGSVEVDGLEVARLPIVKPIAVAFGTRIVGIVAPGFAPLRRAVLIVPKSTAVVTLELVPLEGRLAHLDIRAKVPGLSIVMDGEPVGTSPLPASLALTAGQHELRFERAGYRTLSKAIHVDAGSTGSVLAEPELDRPLAPNDAGWLALTISEPDSVVFVDAASRGAISGAIQLPRGPHWLRIERSDFLPVERLVEIPARQTLTLSVELNPTPQKLARYRSRAESQRSWGWVSVAAGAAIAGGGAAYLLWNAAQERSANAAWQTEVSKNSPGGSCDPMGSQTETCRVELGLALDELHSVHDRNVYGWVGVGVGAASGVLGAVLLSTADDPHRYDPKAQTDFLARLRLDPSLASIRGGSLTLSGSF